MGRKSNKVKTTCSYCGVGCGIVATKLPNGNVDITGDLSHPANRGKLCSKGMNLHYVVNKKEERLLHPQMRWSKAHQLNRVSWDVAIKRAAAVFSSLINKYGPDAVGFYVSGQMLTEEYYIVNKLAKAYIGTNNIDTNSRLCMSSAVVGYKKTLGEDAVPINYDDIELADCFFITGANPAWCHPILFRRIEEHKERNPETKIIVADPRRTQSCSIADLHLQLKPGTDTVLNNAIGRCLIELDAVDYDFVEKHVDGFDEYQRTVFETTVSEGAEICELEESDIRLAAKYIADSKGYISMWAMGLNQSVEGVNKNVSLIDLSLITGKIGKPGSGPFSLTGQPNAMGGREVGGMSNLLPAHRDLANPQHREEVAEYWGVPSVPSKPGCTATEMFDALLDGKMKAVWIICTNPMVSLPNSNKVEAALKKAKFVVVQDISTQSDSAEFADLLLPAAGWLEKEGTMTNSDRRISHVKKLVDAPGEALPDTEILCRFAHAMGYPGMNFESAEQIFEEHKGLTAGTNIDITGLTYQHLIENGTAQWPFRAGESEGTKRLFEDRIFFTPNKKAQIITAAGIERIEPLKPDYPMILTTGRIRDQWHTMTRTGKVNKLRQHIDKPFLEIHPDDAQQKGIRNNDIVVVKSAYGSVQVSAKITEDVKKNVVFLPMHWGKTLQKNFSRTNNITKTEVDPVSKEPDFKFTAVDVEKFKKETERIVIIGGGAAAWKFISTYRKFSKDDDILVFSDEEKSFYNRTLLPEYLSGATPLKRLLKVSEAAINRQNITLFANEAIIAINTEKKTVVSQYGKEIPYDQLIFANGSRANIPREMPLDIKNIFTIRKIDDIERMKDRLSPGDEVAVIGGGLLGLEMVGGLLELGMQPILINRGSKLMERQLDATSSDILGKIITELSVPIIYNDEMLSAKDTENGLNLSLKSGKQLQVASAICAIGTIPNAGIAKQAGIACKRGIVIDEYFQSSAPEVYAIGEVAEFNNLIYGTRAAAEEQAELLARYLNGDLFSYYQPSANISVLKFPGIDICSLGEPKALKNDASYEEIIMQDTSANYYKKCIIKDDILVGAIMIGDKNEFKDFKNLIDEQIELSEKRLRLLRSGEPTEPVMGELVCSCNNVGEGNIQKAIIDGCTDFKALCKQTGAGMGCGSCKPEIKAILAALPVKS